MAAKRRCVIISASPDCDIGHICKNVRSDDYVICADGGVDHLAKTDIVPDLIVGDFDSAARPDAFPGVETITLKTRKIDTDTMHCTDVALERGFTEFLYLGATGGRTDHLLANLSVLLYLSEKGAHGTISDERNDVSVLSPGDNIICVKPGTTLSVMPFACESAELSYEGMSYPLEHGVVNVSYPYTISNEAVSDKVKITLYRGQALLVSVNNQ